MVTFKNFLRRRNKKAGESSVTSAFSDEAIEKYEYGTYHRDIIGDRPPLLRIQSARDKREQWHDLRKANSDRFSRDDTTHSASVTQRSSRSLGSSAMVGPLITIPGPKSVDSDEGTDDSFNVNFHIEQQFGGRSRSAKNVNEDESDTSNRDDDVLEASVGGSQDLDRATVRLDGIEVYAIVSALTCATSISCFDNFDPTPLSIIMRERAVVTLLSELFYYVTGAIGMLTGLHATLIFSLVTMYGRTALGIDRDDAFNAFFEGTGVARFNGFKSFKVSLYCFMTQLVFLIGKKFVFAPLRPFVLLVAGFYSYSGMYTDSESVLKAAGVIYSSPPSEPEPEAETPTNEDRRSSFRQSKQPRRSSVSKTALSTRNFGVDTSQSRTSSVLANFSTSFYG
jgi:hypothetical protein